MPKGREIDRDATLLRDLSYTPKTADELDALAVITEADIEDAVRSASERVPELARFLDARAVQTSPRDVT